MSKRSPTRLARKLLPAPDTHAHAVISPSSYYRVRNCPGSVYESLLLPDIITPYSADGTEIHEWSATALRLALQSKPYILTIQKLKDEWKIDIATSYVEFCVGCYYKARELADGAVNWYVEEKVKLSDLTWGTCDFAIHFRRGGKDYLMVVDLKTGSGHKVYAHDGEDVNSQLALYALAFAKTHNITPDQYFLYIYQPTVHEEGYDKTKVPHSQLEPLLKEVKEIEKTVLRILDNGPKASDFKVGDHCNSFCKLFATCKYYHAERNNTYIGEMDELTPAKVEKFTKQVSKQPVEKLIHVRKMKKQLEDWLSAVDHHLMQLLLDGDKTVSKHYKLVNSRARSSWKKDTEKVASGLIKLGVKKPFKKELITITEAKRLVKDESKLSKLTEKSEGKLQMALLSDPREAVEKGSDDINQMTELKTIERGNTKRKKGAARDVSKKGTRKLEGRISKGRTKRSSSKNKKR